MGTGKIIIVEGPDGSGKGTIIEKIVSKYKTVVNYKFPCNTSKHESRKEIIEKANAGTRQKDLIPLFVQNFLDVLPDIKKDHDDGKTVIIDRMYVSTTVYGIEDIMKDGATEEEIKERKSYISNLLSPLSSFKPDLLIITQVNAQSAHNRITQRSSTTTNVDEKENSLDGDIAKKERINKLYLDYAIEHKAKGENIAIIDSNLPINEMIANVEEALKE
jgi:thymidylate kinase